MHALVAPVLLGFAGFDALREDTEAYPPGGESGETREGGGGEGHTVVGADALG